ncbi:MAG: fatty acid desaturase [Deltaproteobacteria bacterium]|nr:fatty acid desaturase [Deltaproteobacteria bacterium]
MRDSPIDSPEIWDEPLPATADGSLVRVLRDVRRGLLREARIAAGLAAARERTSARQFAVAVAAFVAGTAGVALAVRHAWWLVPLGIALQMIGLAGFVSLNHEAWHGRALPWRGWNDLALEWFLAPILFLDGRTYAEIHRVHHRAPGELDDVSRPLWSLSGAQLRALLLKRALIVPAAIDVVRRLTGLAARGAPVGGVGAAPPVTRNLPRILLAQALWAGPLLASSVAAFVCGYVLPLVLGSICSILREYREHTRQADGRLAVHDTLCSRAERLIIAGGHFNLHALHHIFPEVPQGELPAFYRTIATTVDVDRALYGVSPLVSARRTYLAA